MNPPSYKLFTPGPTYVPNIIKGILGQCPPYYHGDEAFFELMDEVVNPGLRYIFQTERPVYSLACSGTGAMTIAAQTLLDPDGDDDVLVLNGGRFGKRWIDICRSFGSDVDTYDFDSFGDREVAIFKAWMSASNKHYGLVFLQHVETSTGACLPLKKLVTLIKEFNPGCLVVVDAISSLLVEQLHQDAWGIDCVVGASQKAFQLPSGLSFISFSEAAEIKAADVKVNSFGSGPFYFDLAREWSRYYQKGQTQFTPNIQCLVALARAFELMGDNHLFGQWVMTARRKKLVIAKLTTLGYVVESSNDQTRGLVILYCENPKDLMAYLKESHGCLIAGAPDKLSGTAVRISTMGWNVPDSYYDSLFEGLRRYKKLVDGGVPDEE